MTDDGESLTLVYEAKGRVRSSERRGSEATYAYNALGQRMRKSDTTLSTGHRFYAYDEAGRVLGEYDGTGKALEEYVYLDGHRPVAVARNLGLTQFPVVYPILTDHLGTPRKILNPSGTLVWSWDAKDPYGYQAPNEMESGTVFTFDLRFPGQRYDKQTGLFHNGFRDYDPKFGRYVQADPIGLEGGWNHYAYAGSSPLNNYDFTGLKISGASELPEFNEDIKYLSQSSMAREIISQVIQNPATLNITIELKFNSRYSSNNRRNTILWDPRFGLHCEKTHKTLSPAMVLLHEMVHFLQHQAGFPRQVSYPKNGFYEDNMVWHKPIERDAILNYENAAASQLGELVRSSHGPENSQRNQLIFPAVFDQVTPGSYSPIKDWKK
jgi:RHS repeat-associated protein